ncbi:hypothetical protein [Inconstantimicrobium porci]|nr:hypothetical protein [Inconstantimicrobium porci]
MKTCNAFIIENNFENVSKPELLALYDDIMNKIKNIAEKHI